MRLGTARPKATPHGLEVTVHKVREPSEEEKPGVGVYSGGPCFDGDGS